MTEMKITDEHRWLQRMVGAWEAQSDGSNDTMWNESVTPIGEVFVRFEGRGDMPDGTPGMTVMTLGFDPEQNRFTGSFAASMMTHHWVYEGSLDESGTVLTLDTEGPHWETGEIHRFRDIMEYDGGDRRIFRSEILESDGAWKEIMRTEYVRTNTESNNS
jgi:hypothetical protein